MKLEANEIIALCHEKMTGTNKVRAWGEEGIFYNPGDHLARGVYVMTIKQKDGDNDKGSSLDRAEVYRVNTGVSKETFKRLFGEIPKRPAAGEVVDMPYDFKALNKIIPHPVYAWMGWICVLNPTKETFNDFMPYIQESYDLAKTKFAKRVKK